MTEASLRKHIKTALPQTSTSMANAVVDVLVHGHTWRRASVTNDVTESGICRAIKRGKLRDIPGRSSQPY